MLVLRWGEEVRTLCALSSSNNGAYQLCARHVVLEDEDMIEAQLTRSLASKLVLKLAMRNSTMLVLPLVAASWRGVRCVCMRVGQRKTNYACYRPHQQLKHVAMIRRKHDVIWYDAVVEPHVLALNQTGTLSSNHIARGKLQWDILTSRVFVSHKTVLWLTKTVEIEMSHCNLPPCYVIAQQCPHLTSDG